MRIRGKITRVLAVLLIAVFCLTGCSKNIVLQTEAEPKRETVIVPVNTSGSSTKIEFTSKPAVQEKKAAKTLSGDVGSYLDAIDSSVIPEIVEATETKYTFIGDSASGFGIVESTEEELNKMYKERAAEVIKKQGSGYQVESLAQMEEDAVAVLKEISCNNSSVPNVSITYSGNNKFVSTAFGDHIGQSSKTKNSRSSGIYDTKGHFEEAGLSLEMSNFNVEKVIGGESSARLGIITVVVSADTKCIKNEGSYLNLSWIPKVGESRNIKYAVEFWADCYNGSLHEVVMEDLSIVE